MALYTALEFAVNNQFSGETSVCIVMSDTISAVFGGVLFCHFFAASRL